MAYYRITYSTQIWVNFHNYLNAINHLIRSIIIVISVYSKHSNALNTIALYWFTTMPISKSKNYDGCYVKSKSEHISFDMIALIWHETWHYFRNELMNVHYKFRNWSSEKLVHRFVHCTIKKLVTLMWTVFRAEISSL